MRLNIYSQELLVPSEHEESNNPIIELDSKTSNTGVTYSAVRMLFHSSPRLHHPPEDDDRSAVTFWLPRSPERREALAILFEVMARCVREAPAETGMD